MTRRLTAGAFLLALLPAVGCEDEQRAPIKADAKALPNAYWIHDKVISGGQPAGETAFQELEALGVKTVISVDGAQPDVELAKRHGMRYVHLPHSYDGVPEERAKELAKAVRDLPGPIYIHCHHGKHRSPAAAAVACVAAGLIAPEQAVLVLKTAGTSESYRGLYQSAAAARRLDDALLDALEAEFPETAALPPLAEAMVAVEHTHDHLKTIEAAGWKPPADHPALSPSHEALLLREHFTELSRLDEIRHYPQRFQELLSNSEAAAKELENALGSEPDVASADLVADISQTFARITSDCKTCHQQFRDVPLGEK